MGVGLVFATCDRRSDRRDNFHIVTSLHKLSQVRLSKIFGWLLLGNKAPADAELDVRIDCSHSRWAFEGCAADILYAP
jgi:hypothetical protein